MHLSLSRLANFVSSNNAIASRDLANRLETPMHRSSLIEFQGDVEVFYFLRRVRKLFSSFVRGLFTRIADVLVELAPQLPAQQISSE
jgi:hypothetical protein